METYEKKYKDAQKWIESIYTELSHERQMEAEAFFPELKESEDERIRRWCISHFKECINVIKDNDEYKEYLSNKVIAWLEKQKPTDKTAPKFIVGDWIINNVVHGDVPVKIKEIGNYSYLCERQDGVIIELNKNAVFEEFRHWDISDAKDGDVLVASDNSIFLFKCVIDCGCKHYVALTTDNTIRFNEGLEHYWETSRAVHPATKEECELFFQKMKEAGYEWDDDKKELRKIEQKSVEENKGNIGKTSFNWSEEDVNMAERLSGWLDALVNYIHYDALVSLDLRRERIQQVEKIKTWLKSLKEKLTKTKGGSNED